MVKNTFETAITTEKDTMNLINYKRKNFNFILEAVAFKIRQSETIALMTEYNFNIIET